jgi:hypothetical protein
MVSFPLFFDTLRSLAWDLHNPDSFTPSSVPGSFKDHKTGIVLRDPAEYPEVFTKGYSEIFHFIFSVHISQLPVGIFGQKT